VGTSLPENGLGSNRKIFAFPNPAKENVLIPEWKDEMIECYTMDGILLGSNRTDENGNLPLKNWTNGIYLLTCKGHWLKLIIGAN
jgi:hypothetical protein